MKIKKIEILGFKSFVDPTTLVFDHDVTCIVGPNGCGKSNIVDAIKWVMGEQSPSRLRGKSMEDVIFSGSESRSPHGFAEVTLTFDNSDGIAPPEYRDYAEISVSRRLDRQGNSDYFINKTLVRLMDITNLFLGTGVGKRAYSIIEQGRIGFIVTSKAEDRRYMIEDAAGVTKFKLRKRAAERKIDQTRQNLLRVTDIIGELERSLASLKRQSQKAERYKRYRREMRELELYVASHRYLELHTEATSVASSLGGAQEDVQSARNSLTAKEAQVEAERAALQQLSLAVEKKQAAAYELDNRVRQLEALIQQQLDREEGLRSREQLAGRELSDLAEQRAQLVHEAGELRLSLQERATAEAEAKDTLSQAKQALERRKELDAEAETAVGLATAGLSAAQAEIARGEAVLGSFERRREDIRARIDQLSSARQELESRSIDLSQERGEHHARLGGLNSGRLQTQERHSMIEVALTNRRAELQQNNEEVESLREELTVKRSRLNSLTQIQQRFEGVGAGVRALMVNYAPSDESRQSKGLIGPVSDRVDCAPAHTRALAAALGESLDHVVVDDAPTGLRALTFLREGAHGRATVMPSHPRQKGAVPPPHGSVPGVVGRLIDLVKFAPEDQDWVEHLLRGVVVTQSLDAALQLHRQGYLGRVVTLDGEVAWPDGRLTGGAQDESTAHMLEIKRETRALEDAANELQRRLDDAVARQGAHRAEIAEREAAIEAARTAAHGAEIAILGAERDLKGLDAELERLTAEQASNARELESLRGALAQTDVEERTANHDIEEARRRLAECDQQLSANKGVLTQRRRAVEEQARQVTDVSVRATETRERADRDRASLERVERSIEELDAREGRLRGDVSSAQHQQGQAAGRVLLHRGRLSETVQEAVVARDALSASRAELDDAQGQLGNAEAELKVMRGGIDEKATRVNELMLRGRELELAVEHLEEQIADRHRVELRAVLGDYHAMPVPDESQKARAEELQRLIDRMGEINLTAIEEYNENSERYEHLTAQRADLEAALGQLERAIRQMNKESRALFREAFVAINERFKRIFPILFRGGKGELRLVDPQDLLETGVDIMAQPPGKKLGSLELMSGGEKALTAVALIFAIFEFKPTPFCLLDEVDAPLDEANISRFAETIRQMTDRSQFIIITHSKRTMEYADVLYGVTMEEPGISNLVTVELKGERRPVSAETAAA